MNPIYTFRKTGLLLPVKHYKLIEAGLIQQRIMEMAVVVDKHMKLSFDAGLSLTPVSLLKGAAPFYAKIRELVFPGHVPINLHATSYTKQESGPLKINEGALDIEKIKGRIVYLFDDIVDSGQTMCELAELFMKLGALQVVTITLLDKPTGRGENYQTFTVDLNGFTIPSAWAFGFGMDEGNGLEYQWVCNLLDIYYYEPEVNLAEIFQPKLIDLKIAA